MDGATFLGWDGGAWSAATLPAFFSDAVFPLANDADPTRRAVFDLAAIAAGVTRNFELPDVSTELECIQFVRRTAVQTAVHVITTGALIARLTGIAMKLRWSRRTERSGRCGLPAALRLLRLRWRRGRRLAAETYLLCERWRCRVGGRHHRIVRLEAPFAAVVLRRHAVGMSRLMLKMG